MPQNAPAVSASAPLFDAVLTPNDSSTPTGRWMMRFFLVAYAAILGMLCLSWGAWPAFAHGVVVIAFLAWSAYADRRRAAQWERITVWHAATIVEKGAGNEILNRSEWPTPWLRVSGSDPASRQMTLGCCGRHVTVGGFLAPDDRASFAAALIVALQTARRPGLSNTSIEMTEDLKVRRELTAPA